MSRWTMLVLGLVVWVVGMPLAHGVVPWAISLLATRYGWIDGRPGMLNLLGLVPVLVGITLLIWTFVTGLRNVHRMPERVEVFVPPFLLTSGPYAFTRNPMYLGLLLVLLGWAAYLSNALACVFLPAFVLYMNRFQIGPEERALAALFGQAFLDYKNRVRRWV